MTKATETKTKAPSIKSLRNQIERELLTQIRDSVVAGDAAALGVWMGNLTIFTASQNGGVKSSNGTAESANGQQAALPGIGE